MKQTSFLKKLGYNSSLHHGGATNSGKRKARRPLDPKYPVHLVLKSSKARGSLSFLKLKNRKFIGTLLFTKAKKFDVRLQGVANVGNHIHLKVRFKRRQDFQQFLKSVTSLIARFVTGAKRGKKFGKFWDALAYSKVVKAWAQEKKLDRYIDANVIEAEFGRAAREAYLNQLNESG